MNLMSMLTDCMDNGFEVPEVVQKKLKEKYGETFTLTNIGDRINTGTARLFCYPDNRESIRFSVIYDYENKEIHDDYAARSMAVEFDEILAEKFRNSGFNCTSLTVFVGMIDYSDISADEKSDDFIKRQEVESLFIHLAVKSGDINSHETAQYFLNALKDISLEYSGKQFIVSAFYISDEDYERCCEELSLKPAVNRNWFEKFRCKYSADIVVCGENINISADELIKGIKGDRF